VVLGGVVWGKFVVYLEKIYNFSGITYPNTDKWVLESGFSIETLRLN
jgi:hypothetical protein